VQPGDIILKFNGKPVETMTDLPRMVGELKPGANATVTLWRKGKARDLPLTIGTMLPEKASKADAKKALPPKPTASNVLGIGVSDLSAEQLKTLKVHNGVLIETVAGPAARIGLRKGDLIMRVGDTDITSAKQFADIVAHLDPQKTVALLVRRGDLTQFVPLRPRAARGQ
jgi:serine protease Do